MSTDYLVVRSSVGQRVKRQLLAPAGVSVSKLRPDPTRFFRLPIGFLILIAASYVLWAVVVDPSWWLGLVVAMVGYFLYGFMVLPWAMRLTGLRRGRTG